MSHRRTREAVGGKSGRSAVTGTYANANRESVSIAMQVKGIVHSRPLGPACNWAQKFQYCRLRELQKLINIS